MLLFNLILSAAIAAALPTPESSEGNKSQPFSHAQPWNAGAVNQFPIHSSCNATQRRQIEQGLNETITLASHAQDHILRWKNESEIYRKYFGDRPTMEALGAFDVVVNGDKNDILFRCDNPDGNCANEGWAGHWRGENATGETVICDLSYETRRSLSTMCGLGYTVSESETNTFWAADLLHRLYHVPAFGQKWIDHFADGYEEVIDQAKTNATLSTHDSETLQYFALEVYAFDIAVPGTGCPGVQHEHDHEESHADQTTSEAATSQPTPSATNTDAPSTTLEVPAVSRSMSCTVVIGN
ncbi:Antigen 1 [Penicillium digitatum PHI26]|uniref:Antigen 1 n=2 Tax=Penicillium digitatum TaxID=36651 RepID=K9G7R0_PEND2|nr:Antigen 1 [Penicillium digitatum Pd1]EKV07786.1 Antigen 1 [Penicillium digitatum Pd1]EKV09276.1 Antigen 1 [Penicillium digitatum PHI26]